MKHIIRATCKISIIIISFLLLLALLSPIFTPKFCETWPTTRIIDGFYELDDNSIDVLFLGSSQIMTAVTPMQMYQDNGITAYNLGTEQQNMINSYYLLKETLKTQKPKVVILDVMFLFQYAHATPLNSSEVFIRKTVDSIHWSADKWELVNTICNLDSEHELNSYLLPILRYHSRWKELSLNDITYLFQSKHDFLKGYTYSDYNIPSEYMGFEVADTTSTAYENIPDTMNEYFYKIIDLCKENNISLILLKTPKADGSFGEAYHNTIVEIADKNSIPFIDFNEEKILSSIDFNPATDYADGTHVNYKAAQKMTTFLTDYLTENYDLADHRGESKYLPWNDDLAAYQVLMSGAK